MAYRTGGRGRGFIAGTDTRAAKREEGERWKCKKSNDDKATFHGSVAALSLRRVIHTGPKFLDTGTIPS